MFGRFTPLFFGFFLLFSFSVALLALPQAASAQGLVVCALNSDKTETPTLDESAPCTLCHIVLMGKNVIDWITKLMVIIAIVVMVAMAIYYIVSAGNSGMIETAKKGIIASLVGVAIILSAWLIINTVLFLFAGSSFVSGFVTDGAFNFTCDTTSSAKTSSLQSAGSGGPSGGGSGTTPPGSGTCSVITTANNPCSVAALANTCFSQENSRISQLCNVESRGEPNSQSGTDVCINYEKRSFSGGLFQINVFSNGAMLSQSCANLGNKGSCANRRADGVCLGWKCNITDLEKFDNCMKLTFTASNNITAACQLSNNGANLNPWVCTAQKCSLGGYGKSNLNCK
jgi:hypothetical protein